jgi:hypothetical protein
MAHLRKALETGNTINVADWVSDISRALADMILHGAPSVDQAALIAHAHRQLDQHIAEKRAQGIGIEKQ